MGAAAGAAALTGLLLGGPITPFVMVTELVPPRLTETASGVVSFFCFVGGLVVPVVPGYAFDLTGGFRTAFTAGAIVEVVALAIACTRESGGRAATASGSGGSC